MISDLKTIVAMGILSAATIAVAQVDQKQSAQPPVESIVAESNPGPSLSDVAQQSSDSVQPVTKPSQLAAAPVPPPIPASLMKMILTNAKYTDLAPWDWDTIVAPTPGDSILGEAGGVRADLAKKGLWFTAWTNGSYYYNLANPPMYGALGKDTNGSYLPVPKGTSIAYAGQKPTWVMMSSVEATYTNERTQTQVGVGLYHYWCTDIAVGTDDALRFSGLYLNQRFFKKKLKITMGYVGTGYETVGIFLGGNLAGSLLGVNSILDVEVGQGVAASFPHPTFMVKYDLPKHFYTVSSIERSNQPDATSTGNPTTNWHDVFYLPFAPKGAKAFLLEEIGIKRATAPGVKSLWLRLDGFYNYSHYDDYRYWNPASPSFNLAAKTKNNFGSSDALDYQATQPDKVLPFRGLYVGSTIQYAPPQQNVYTQYYEARAYYIGLLKNRPLDMTTVMVNHLGFSKIFNTNVEVGLLRNSSSDDSQENISATYLGHIHQGIWLNGGFDYVLHPTIAPKTPTALVFTTGLTLFF